MKTTRSLFVRGLGAAVTLAAVAFCSLNAQAEVVFGNLDASGTSSYTGSSTDLKPGQWLAQGFDTGTSSNLTVSSVTMSLFGSNAQPLPFSVAIYSNDAILGDKPSSPLFTSDTVPVGAAGNYTFSFTSAILDANTKYWIVPSGGVPSAWYLRTGGAAAPVGQNDSGYSFVGTAGSQANTPSPAGPWSQTSEVIVSNGYTVSITAVPEPSTVVLAGFGVLGIAVMARSRKIRRPAAAA